MCVKQLHLRRVLAHRFEDFIEIFQKTLKQVVKVVFADRLMYKMKKTSHVIWKKRQELSKAGATEIIDGRQWVGNRKGFAKRYEREVHVNCKMRSESRERIKNKTI